MNDMHVEFRIKKNCRLAAGSFLFCQLRPTERVSAFRLVLNAVNASERVTAFRASNFRSRYLSIFAIENLAKFPESRSVSVGTIVANAFIETVALSSTGHDESHFVEAAQEDCLSQIVLS